MPYHITHTSTYTYAQPVLLGPHWFRFQPRSDAYQHLLDYQLHITPEPLEQTTVLDIEGNTVTHCWWASDRCTHLQVESQALVVTICTNPFKFLLEPWATQLPLNYPLFLFERLRAYQQSKQHDPVAYQLAQEIGQMVDWNTVLFLSTLNQHINGQCRYESRLVGAPQPPSFTWTQKVGTCRDFVVLFIAVCRSVGLAARFVSGYEEGDPQHEQTLHAWAEVYLPGAGWRGYDPTLGIAVADRHVAIAASAIPSEAAPVSGSHRGNGASNVDLETQVTIRKEVPRNREGLVQFQSWGGA